MKPGIEGAGEDVRDIERAKRSSRVVHGEDVSDDRDAT